MRRSSPLRQRLAALGLAGVPLFSYPLVATPSGDVLGIPTAFFYLFGVWVVLIGLAAWFAEAGGG